MRRLARETCADLLNRSTQVFFLIFGTGRPQLQLEGHS